MVQIFSKTTSRLAEEYVSSFPADKLAIALFKISQDTGVELSKQNRSFLVTGSWNNVIHAHTLLENFLDNIELPFQPQNYDPGPSVITNTARPRGRKPGTTLNLKINLDLPEPMVIHHNQHAGSLPIETFIAEQPNIKCSPQETALNVPITDTKQSLYNGTGDGLYSVSSSLAQSATDSNEIPTTSSEKQKVEYESATVEHDVKKSVEDVIVTIKKEVNDDEFDEETDVDEQYLSTDVLDQTNSENSNQDTGDLNENNASDDEGHRAKNIPNPLKVKTKRMTKLKTPGERQLEVCKEECPVQDIDKMHKKGDKWALECPVCDYVAKTSRIAKEHYNRKHGPEIKCDICSKIFHQQKDMNRHKKRVHSMMIFACDVCGKKFKCEESQKTHMKHHHNSSGEKPYCNICERTYCTKLVLEKHIKTFHPDLSWDGSGENTERAVARKPLTRKWKLNCPEPDCDYIGKNPKNTRDHHRRAHGIARRCHICDKVFKQNKDLNRHVRQVHSDPAFFCDICGKIYKSARAYKGHMEVHEEDYVKPSFSCEICQKSFSSKYVLTAHVKSSHLGISKSYICPTCGRSFTQRNTYLQHANVHAGIKPYVCDVCGKAFSYEKSLKEHKRIHGSERKYKCPVCGKDFKQKASLQIHSKVHKDTRDYMCQSCGKGFTQKQALYRHERIHSGDKPYKCNLCQKTFNDYSIIRRHMIMLHKREAKDIKQWKQDIICTIKRSSNFYIEGGTGYNSGERLRTEEPVSTEENIPMQVTDMEMDLMANTIDKNSAANVKESDDLELVSNEIGLKEDSARATNSVLETIKKEQPSVHTLQETSETFHQLSRAAFPLGKNTDPGHSSPPLAPINYTVPSDYSILNRSSTPQDNSDSRYQNIIDSYRHFPPGLPHVQGMVGQQIVRSQLAHPIVETSQGQQMVPNWPYTGLPYYSPQQPQ